MAINPPSDIVMDVLKAADPERVSQVTQRLSNLSAAAPAGSDAFSAVLDQKAASSPTSKIFLPINAAAPAPRAAHADSSRTSKVETDFEASILGSFVQELLPKDTQDVFGQGSAGDIWRSMLGDQIARQIAKSGELGIAKKLFETHAFGEHTRAAALNSNAQNTSLESTVEASANPLSAGSEATIRNNAVLFADRKRG